MKRWSAIVLLGAIIVWAIVDTAHDFKANDTIGYFSEKPLRLLYILAIGVVGGVAFFAFDRLSPGTKHKAKLLGLGAAATLLTGFAAQMGYGFIIYFSLLFPSSVLVVLVFAALVLFFASLAALLWLEFFTVLKTRHTRWLHKLL